MQSAKIIIATVCLIVLVTVVGWRAQRLKIHVDPASERSVCRNNLKWIGLAMRSYVADHGSFPPTFTVDKDSQPAHSWRVLILPYLDRMDLYNAYRFDEPWDGPNNRTLATNMPSVFRCPSCVDETPATHTNYVACVDIDAVMAGAAVTAMNSILDPTSETVLIAGTRSQTVHWMSPLDLQSTELYNALVVGGGVHERGIDVLVADGAVVHLPHTMTRSEFDGLVTRAGGEPHLKLRYHPERLTDSARP